MIRKTPRLHNKMLTRSPFEFSLVSPPLLSPTSTHSRPTCTHLSWAWSTGGNAGVGVPETRGKVKKGGEGGRPF